MNPQQGPVALPDKPLFSTGNPRSRLERTVAAKLIKKNKPKNR